MQATPSNPNEPGRSGAQYHVDQGKSAQASDEQIEKWANDPLCFERDLCARILQERLGRWETERVASQNALAAKRKELLDNPFDSRTEVTADARHIAGKIVRHLWILFGLFFLLLPFMIAVVLAMVGVIK